MPPQIAGLVAAAHAAPSGPLTLPRRGALELPAFAPPQLAGCLYAERAACTPFMTLADTAAQLALLPLDGNGERAVARAQRRAAVDDSNFPAVPCCLALDVNARLPANMTVSSGVPLALVQQGDVWNASMGGGEDDAVMQMLVALTHERTSQLGLTSPLAGDGASATWLKDCRVTSVALNSTSYAAGGGPAGGWAQTQLDALHGSVHGVSDADAYGTPICAAAVRKRSSSCVPTGRSGSRSTRRTSNGRSPASAASS